MPVVVLVHGSWHHGELWEPVAKPLRAMGWEVHTPTVAGHGKGADKTVNHAQCTQSIIDYIVGKDLKDAVILGHSWVVRKKTGFIVSLTRTDPLFLALP